MQKNKWQKDGFALLVKMTNALDEQEEKTSSQKKNCKDKKLYTIYFGKTSRFAILT